MQQTPSQILEGLYFFLALIFKIAGAAYLQVLLTTQCLLQLDVKKYCFPMLILDFAIKHKKALLLNYSVAKHLACALYIPCIQKFKVWPDFPKAEILWKVSQLHVSPIMARIEILLTKFEESQSFPCHCQKLSTFFFDMVEQCLTIFSDIFHLCKSYSFHGIEHCSFMHLALQSKSFR